MWGSRSARTVQSTQVGKDAQMCLHTFDWEENPDGYVRNKQPSRQPSKP